MLKKIHLKNYRNIKEFNTELTSDKLIIIAPNSTGKTNLLESIYLGIYGNSFKSIESIKEIIGVEEEFAKVSLEWDDAKTDVVISIENEKTKKSYLYNSKQCMLSKLVNSHSAIVFAPNSVDIISGDPVLRRQDLNSFLSSLSKDYANKIILYEKLLKNRNALLKIIRDGKSSADQLIYWNEKLLEASSFIFEERQKFFNEVSPFINNVVKDMNIFLKSEEYKYLAVKYMPNLEANNILEFKEALKNKFIENKQKEIYAGKTLYGVHKDDFAIFIKDKNLRFFGSRGQQRLATLLLKLAQIKYLKDIVNKESIFLIDDLMSELDSINRDNIAAYLVNSDTQFILTTAEEFEIPRILADRSRIIFL